MKLGDVQSTYTPNVGEEEGPCYCGVCGEKMKELRNQYGATTSMAARFGNKRNHDFFYCPNREESWHKQVVNLRMEAKVSSSARIRDMLLEEAQEVLDKKQPTVDKYWTYY